MSKDAGNNELAPKHRTQLFVMIFLFFAAGLIAWIGSLAEEVAQPEDVEKRNVVIKLNDASDNLCYELCQSRKEKRNEYFGGDLLNRQDLLPMLQKAKTNLLASLKADYGMEHFDSIFVDKNASTGYRGFGPVNDQDISMKRLIRKLQIKILQMQTAIHERESNVSGRDCNENKALVSNIENVTADSMHVHKTYNRYVWATGGHSAAVRFLLIFC